MTRFILILATFFFSLPSSVSALEITFSPDAEVISSFVTLGDIARFNEKSPLSIALGSKHIAQAPKAGETVSLNNDQIRIKLLNNFSGNKSIQWNGTKTTLVTRKGLVIGPQEVESAIANYLEDRMSDLPLATYSFIPRELPIPFVLPTGQLEVDVIPADQKVIGSRRFTLVYKVDGKTVKNISIRGKLEALASVAVLTKNVKRGSILHPHMVQMQTKDLSKLRTPCTNLREVLGKKLTRSLRSGAVLDLSSIDFPPLIHKGQLVKIRINHNGMHLTATGISSMNGKKDQIIRVMNSVSRKTIFCKVAAPGLVEVQI
jgi:flagellar basal body P-ring formation protein FlgA